MTQPPTDETPATFEGSLAQLQKIVNDLEEGNLGLESSLLLFEDGIRLLRSCYKILAAAEQKIEILTGVDETGTAVTVTFDASATFEGSEKPDRKPGRRRGAAKEKSTGGESSPGVEPTGREEGGLF